MIWPTKKLEEVLEKNGIIPAKIKRGEYHESGKYPVVDQGESLIAGYIDDKQKLYQGDLPVVIFGDHTRILKYVDFPFAFGADGIKILRPQEILLPKFFYYTLIFNPVANQGYKRHFSLLTHTKILIPPLAIQKQIVERLDKIAEAQKLNDGLIQKTNELFQSLLHKELNPAGKNWEVKKLNEVLEINYGKGLDKSERVDSGKFFAYGSNGPVYRTNESLTNGEVIIIGRKGTAGALYFVSEPCWPIDTAFFAKPKNDASLKFVFYLLQTKNLPHLAIVTGVPGINRTTLANINIQLPPLETQKQIVAKLSTVQDYKKQLLEQKTKLKELFDSSLAKSMKN